MTGVTNAQLAAQLAEFLANSDPRERELRDWQSGTALGGPFSDGRYPITNFLGEVYYYKSPAALVNEVDSTTSGALAHKLGAETAQTAAEAALASTVTAVSEALGHADQSEIYKDIALAAEVNAANHAANALVYRNASQAAQTASELAEYGAQQAETNAAAHESTASQKASEASTSADEAAASAVAAATFDPENFYTQTQADSIFKPIGYHPTWAQVTGKPTTFTPSAHSHAIADVTGLQGALDGKQAAGSYAAASHSHSIGDVTGLQSALDGKQAAGSYASVSHTHDYLPLTGGTVTGVVNLERATPNLGLVETDAAADEKVWRLIAAGGSLSIRAYADDGSSNQAIRIERSLKQVTNIKLEGDYLTFNGTNVSLDGHGHAISDVTGLQVALDGKQAAGSYADASHTHSPDPLIFNNMGLWHGAYTDLDAAYAGGFGFRFSQGNTNGPATGATQFYTLNMGLGSEYPNTSYGMQVAFPRRDGDNYLSMRVKEGGAWEAWRKVSAGYADNAGTLGGIGPSGFAAASHTHAYLPLAGGTVTGSISMPALEVTGDATLSGQLKVGNHASRHLRWDSVYTTYQNEHGYFQSGCGNASYAHFYTDRPNFYFSNGMHVNGVIKRYNQGAYIQHVDTAMASGRMTTSTASPSGGADGDIWLKV